MVKVLAIDWLRRPRILEPVSMAADIFVGIP